MKTLITAATSGEAQRLKNKLEADAVILGDYLQLPEFMLKTGNIIRLPDPKSIAYTHEMLALCLDKEIQTIYPLTEQEKILLKEAEQLFQEYDITIVHG
ncbi:MAG: hypothetical protein NVSMB24_29690 [Mucilaginibacter sp.]